MASCVLRPASCVLLALSVIFSAGCGAPRPQAGPPGVTVFVANDGFHSLLLVPGGWVGQDPDGWSEASYGDWDWMTAADTSTCHVSRLVLWPSRAGMVFQPYGADPTMAAVHAGWAMQPIGLSPAGAAALRRELASWYDPTARPARLDPDGTAFYPASRDFHVLRNCHDQVADCLSAAGVPLAGSWLPWRTVDRFSREVAAARAELAGQGIAWVGPEP
jgi:hypothetical protein